MADSEGDGVGGAPLETCVICYTEYKPNDMATSDACNHPHNKLCFRCFYKYVTSKHGSNKCPICRNLIKFLFTVDEQVFPVYPKFISLRVEVDGGRYVDAQFRIETREKMLVSLLGYEQWLGSLRGDEKLYFHFRGVLLDGSHRLSRFSNVREGEVITVEVGIKVIIEYAGSRWLNKYRKVFYGTTRTNFTMAFKDDYFRRMGRWDVEFEYCMENGRRMSSLGGGLDMNNQLIVAREIGYRLGGR